MLKNSIFTKNVISFIAFLFVLLIIVVSVCYLVGKPSVETADTVDTPSETEQLAVKPRVKMPPPGESSATGHWEGDVWKRTVPPDPETLTHEGKTMTLWDLLMTAYQSTDSWEERVAILNRIIAEAPYSEEAYLARDHLAKYENGERIWDDALLFERHLTMLEFHPDEPRLLISLLLYGSDVNPEAAIHYGKEILKNNEAFYAIHYRIAYPYELIGDYSSALYHYKRCVELMRADPESDADLEQIATENIELILAGTPTFGPLARKSDDAVPVRPSIAVEGEIDIMELLKRNLPADIDPDDIPPFYTVSESGRKYHYNRPLTVRERVVYESLKNDPSYKGDTPATLKMAAVVLVRDEKIAAGALDNIYQRIASGEITGDEARSIIAEFYERTP